MRYGFVSGFNFLWNSIQKNFNKNEWRNWGGNKTWAAPQLWWSTMSGRDWPPDEVWDGSPHKTRILSNGHLQTTSEVTSGMGARTVREYWFEKNGDFTIRQTVEKVTGEPLLLSIWNVTQIVSPDAMFVPLNPKSPYKQNFHWITPVNNGSPVVHITPTLLQLRPSIDNDYKIGADSPVAALAAVKDGIAMVERSERPPGNYPDGAVGAGFPVEVYSQGGSKIAYSELELLSPLRLFKKGDRFEHIIYWSLHQLPSRDVNSKTTRVAVEKLLAS